jgi:hypothetical protein
MVLSVIYLNMRRRYMPRSRKSRDGNGNNNVEMEPEPEPQPQPQPNPPPALWAGIQQLHQLGLPQGVQQGQILPANPFIQGQVAAIPANPQQANPAVQGFGAALAAQGQGQLIPPGLVINNPNPNPQGRKRKSRKQKSRKKSRKHKSNRR